MPRNVETDTDETAVDDTSEEEDTETENSEDQGGEEEESEESTDSEEESEEEEEGGEEEGDDSTESKTKQYLDLKKVPAELQEAAKRMLATHTKAMQRIPDLVKQKLAEAENELQVKYSAAIVKAKGFDALTNLPSFKKFYDDVQEGRPYGFSSDFRKNGKASKVEDDDFADSSDSSKLDNSAIEERIMSRIQRLIKDEIAPLRQERTKDIWEDAEKNLPNFGKYRAAVTAKLAEHPTLSVIEAYDLVAKKEVIDEKVRSELKKAEERSRKVPKKSLKPGSGSTKPLTKTTIKSIDDALNHARRDMVGASGR